MHEIRIQTGKSGHHHQLWLDGNPLRAHWLKFDVVADGLATLQFQVLLRDHTLHGEDALDGARTFECGHVLREERDGEVKLDGRQLHVIEPPGRNDDEGIARVILKISAVDLLAGP